MGSKLIAARAPSLVEIALRALAAIARPAPGEAPGTARVDLARVSFVKRPVGEGADSECADGVALARTRAGERMPTRACSSSTAQSSPSDRGSSPRSRSAIPRGSGRSRRKRRGTPRIGPRALAEDAGVDAIEALVHLRSAHEAGQRSDGFLPPAGDAGDAWDVGAVEPLRVRRQAIASATEVACTIYSRRAAPFWVQPWF